MNEDPNPHDREPTIPLESLYYFDNFIVNLSIGDDD